VGGRQEGGGGKLGLGGQGRGKEWWWLWGLPGCVAARGGHVGQAGWCRKGPVVMVLLLPAGRLPAGKRQDQPEKLTVLSCHLLTSSEGCAKLLAICRLSGLQQLPGRDTLYISVPHNVKPHRWVDIYPPSGSGELQEGCTVQSFRNSEE